MPSWECSAALQGWLEGTKDTQPYSLAGTASSHLDMRHGLAGTARGHQRSACWACRDGSSRQASLVRLGNMEAVSSEAAVYHVSAVAAQLEARDGRIGEASGKQLLSLGLLV